ncbi:MAG TPA: TonB-dependent receptor [Terriglobales bacterium]|nr:TonB-dependent receptor [Terriglobales bacterium]
MRIAFCQPFGLVGTVIFAAALAASGQTVSTGAVTGSIFDPTGAVLAGATVLLTEENTSATQSKISDGQGNFSFALLEPGTYEITAASADYGRIVPAIFTISATETVRLELHLHLGRIQQHTEVVAKALMVETESATLGRVVGQAAVANLPLVSRNFTQIAGLSPGVSTAVSNAGELGLGGNGFSQIGASYDGMFVHGGRSYDNNFQMDGISVSDAQGSGNASGGVPIPNPDTIQEFKVQTALYDAAYGRYGGANIAIVTRSGSNAYHGSVFEFLRNEALNANDFFFDQTGQPKPELRLNQFGFDLGGPIQQDRLLFFGSYQGTRQVNGLAAGQARTGCTVTLLTPPLTNDRSAAALGKLFGGRAGSLGGVRVASDGSNINPVTLDLLSFKLADGSYFIPTPQTIDSSRPFASQGFSTFSQPCHFSEDQFLVNADYLASAKSRVLGRFFWANNNQAVTFPGNGFNPAGNLEGFPSAVGNQFRVLSVGHTFAISAKSLNEARLGFIRTRGNTTAQTPFAWSDLGVTAGMENDVNGLPSLSVEGSISFAPGFPRTFTQNSFWAIDDFSTLRGKHMFRMGGSLTRFEDNIDVLGVGSVAEFLSWPDFLLGLSSAQNRSAFSNLFSSGDGYGLFERAYRSWEASAYGLDEYRFSQSLTLNFGLRFERLGQLADGLGRNASFDINKADANPPMSGSAAGYVVAANFPGTPPPGVRRASNSFGNDGLGQNAFAPRVGFAWQPYPQSVRLVIRGGYGLYFSRPTGQAFFMSDFGAPFGEARFSSGMANARATFQNPFAQPFPTAADFPQFPLYSPSSAITVSAVSPRFRPSVIEQFGLNVQSEFARDFLLEIGYVGTHGTSLLRTRTLNQALDASPQDPVRGVTDNTLTNIETRVPVLGIAADTLKMVESEGESWYNGLEASLTKRLGHGLQFLASYTFSKALDTDGANVNSTSAGNQFTLGDQNSPRQRWGRASFDRTNRFVFSTIYSLPSPKTGLRRALVGGWTLAAVAVVQSGAALTVAYTNAKNVFGIPQDRAQLTGCPPSQLVTAGEVESKLNLYFNTGCFTTPPVIGADGLGTAFGDSATGLVNGPDQANFDLSLAKAVPLAWPTENGRVEFRAAFFNVFNHPQFANPDNDLASPAFGVISSTAVNPRVGQLALKFIF